MNKGDLEEIIQSAKGAKESCHDRMALGDKEEKSQAYVQLLLVEITAKAMASDFYGKDVKPLVSVLEQARDILNDVMGEDNFDV